MARRDDTRDAAIAALRELEERSGPVSSSAWPKLRPAGAPGLNTIYGHFGSWAAFREAAGLVGPVIGRTAKTREELIRDLRACAEVLGKTPSTTAYDKWRETTEPKPASSSVIRKVLGPWVTALTTAELGLEGFRVKKNGLNARARVNLIAAQWSDAECRAIFEAARTLITSRAGERFGAPPGLMTADAYERVRAAAGRELPEWDDLLEGMRSAGHNRMAQPPVVRKDKWGG